MVGGALAGALRDEVDVLVVKRNPVAIGAGVPLFAGPFEPTGLRRTGTRAFETGVVGIGGDTEPYVRTAGTWGGRVTPGFEERFVEAYDREIQAWVDEAAPRHRGYTIETFVDAVPDDLVESLCVLLGQLAVDAPTDGTPVETPYGRVAVSHVDLNDDVVEGLRCLDAKAFSVQYHPEAAPGPHDATGLFPAFAALMGA